jgi:hypothetical protein
MEAMRARLLPMMQSMVKGGMHRPKGWGDIKTPQAYLGGGSGQPVNVMGPLQAAAAAAGFGSDIGKFLQASKKLESYAAAFDKRINQKYGRMTHRYLSEKYGCGLQQTKKRKYGCSRK